ncbi:MAG: RNA methyltransferase [Saprospiraceae bacterium]|nr:RNA methyltransferase [Saprospiraceae bacterium]
MISKNTIKYLRSLHLKKFRQKYNKFIVEGDKICREFLQQSRFKLNALYATDYWIKTNENLINVYQQQCFNISDRELKQISALSTPNQVILIAEMDDRPIDYRKVENSWALYLDGLQDPGNVGTILRIANWFGVDYVFTSMDTVEIFNPKVVQASMGAFLRVHTEKIDLGDLKAQMIEDFPIIGTVLDGENIYHYQGPKNGIIVIGNEGSGIKKENMNFLSHRLTIPSISQTGMESLNAGVASGIVCALLIPHER